MLPDAIVTAHEDSTLRVKVKRGAKSIRYHGNHATVLYAVKGPQNQSWRLLVGDSAGQVTLYSLPGLNPLQKWKPHSTKVTAICVPIKRKGAFIVLSGDCNGGISLSGDEVPNESIRLFDAGGEVNIIFTKGDYITIHSGWAKKRFHWTGDEILDCQGNSNNSSKKDQRNQLTPVVAC